MISTLYDFISKTLFKNKDNKRMKDSFVCKTFQSFSAISNIKSIFFAERGYEKFKYMDGLRAVMAFIPLLCHEHQISFLQLNSKNNDFAWRFITSKNYMHIKNIHIIDTFFFLGGIQKTLLLILHLNYKFNQKEL